jgi:uncharacterized Zn-finger protein
VLNIAPDGLDLNSGSLIVSHQRVSSTPSNGQPAAARAGSWVSGWFMGPFETIYIDEMVAACNGGGGPLGHPRVYLNLAPAGRVECPYCSRLYVNRAMHDSGAEARITEAGSNPTDDGSATSG